MNNYKSNPLNHKNYFSYLYSNAKHTPLVQSVKNIYKFLSKYILVGRIYRYARLLFIWIQTGAYFLLISTALIILIPIIVVSVLLFLLYTLHKHRKYNKVFTDLISNNKVCIIFKNNESEIQNACPDTSIHIFVIKDPFTGLTDCVNIIDSKTYMISMSYFYSLKKHVLERVSAKINYLNNEEDL